jgi:proline iminopeptidase
MLSLYPPIEPYHSGFIDVGDGHQMYYELSGNPKGQPVLFVHGGPGGGCTAEHRRFFDPHTYHIILFDQRGAGRSRPHAELTNNTTAHLIADIEQLRQHLQIDCWLLFGGSWGSTLSLLYAQSYPQHTQGLILRGIFLCRDQDIDWFYQKGASEFFADYWQDYIAPIAQNERQALVQAYYKRLTGDDEVARMRAAAAWSIWEGRTSNLKTDPNILAHFADPHHALAMARIECHYFIHKAFIATNQILEHTNKLKQIPCTIVHGRYDMVCPINQAFALKQAMPHAELIICPKSGHSAFEAEITHALVSATQGFSR